MFDRSKRCVVAMQYLRDRSSHQGMQFRNKRAHYERVALVFGAPTLSLVWLLIPIREFLLDILRFSSSCVLALA